MLLCQISDTHIKTDGKLAYGIVDTAGMLERCVEPILQLPQRPDAVIATGDLVDYGRPEEYALLRELLSPLTMPLYLLPGNHDDRDVLRASFPDHPYLNQWEPFIQYAIDAHTVRIVALDTVIPKEGGGRLCRERLEWLNGQWIRRLEPDELIDRLRTSGVAVILISHSMDQVMAVADRAMVMRRGRKIGEAPATADNQEQLVSWIVGARGSTTV